MSTVRLVGKRWGQLNNTFLLTVDDEMLKKLDNYATITGMHRTELVRRAIHTVFREYVVVPTDDVYDDNDEIELVLPTNPVGTKTMEDRGSLYVPAEVVKELEKKVVEDKPKSNLRY